MKVKDFIRTEAEYRSLSNRELQDLYNDWTDWYARPENMDDNYTLPYYFVRDLLFERQSKAWTDVLDDPLPTNGGIN